MKWTSTAAQPLQFALWANVIYSTVTGLLLMELSAPAEILGAPRWLTFAVGLGLIDFALVVGWVSRRPQVRWVRAIIAADVLWVVASAVAVMIRPDWLILVGGAATGVAAVALAQWATLRNSAYV